ncbi:MULTISPECIES: diguanylate cyclase domain-containing protein [unclassified Cyanobium]|uniref:diguanylate cyclase domain-containing protein n=1 Tax=unclassified Cyanobium TaxID=2627006 RepID=UPI0020CDBB77|nr:MULTISPECIES: diguanylate cyclase [unclassified Cyanobium]MCP9777655.1 diguanylate cyclase [Cyanobium sp. Tous-M-B4]MCP9877732.1 diguanylate cyclase [Cyanobium sp. A2C-AMD]
MTLAPSAERFPELFPFHLAVDADLVIRQLGPALLRLLGNQVCGAPLSQHVQWLRPRLSEPSLAGLHQRGSKLTVLQLLDLPLQLKGQVLVDGQHAFFLGTPVVHKMAQLNALGIRLSDMAHHDGLADSLVMLQTKEMTIADLVQRRTQDLERLATQDALTGVGNRLLFNRELPADLDEHRQTGQPMALLLLDVDLFKRFNDAHGHLAGDACLRAVAQRLVDLAGRGGDRVFRYGGEEFAILLPQTGIQGARLLAERIVHGFASSPLQPEDSDQRHLITVSVGLACFDPSEPQGQQSPADQETSQMATNLISRADKALYQAKDAGRSRFVSLV